MIISIDKQSVLDFKITESDIIKEEFDKLMLDKTPVNTINFIKFFKSCKKKTMIENLSYLYQINTVSSMNLLKMLIESSDMTEDELTIFKECSNNWFCGDNSDKKSSIIDLSTIIDNKINNMNNISTIKADIQFNLNKERICPCCAAMETYLADDLEVIMYNINDNPEVIEDFEKIVRDIKMNNTTKYLTSYPMILKASTELVLFTKININGDILDLITCIPTVIADKLIKFKLSKKDIKPFINLYDIQIKTVYTELKQGDPTMYKILSTYVKKLVTAKNDIEKSYSNVLSESVIDMQPEVGAEDIEVVKQQIEDSVVDFMLNEDANDDELFESFTNLLNSSSLYVSLTEDGLYGRPSNSVKRTQGLAKVNRKLGTKIQGAANNINRKKVAINKSFQPIVNTINKVVNDAKEKDAKSRREDIITGRYRFNLLRVIRTGLSALFAVKAGTKVIKFGIIGLSALVNPILAAIGILVSVAIDKRIEQKHRKKILSELESELKMVKEKVEDARNDGEREKKYQLMRIQEKLEKDIERIKFNLK